MLNYIKKICARYKDVLLYLIFGVLTTLINQLSFWISNNLLGESLISVSVSVSWFVSVLFAYITNRTFVFSSKTKGSAVIKEILSFFGARVFSGLIDLLIVNVAVKIFGFDANLTKLSSNILVIIINYFFSKFLIFKKENQ